ncbi:MAG: hypothetical protein ACLQIQ_16750 [Beijerinckiaceae bacterium]
MTKLAVVRAAQSRANSTLGATIRQEQPLICVWTRDPGTSRLVCRWQRADAEQPQSDLPFMIRDRGRPPSAMLAAA